MRFPFTFIGILALVIGAWVLLYLAVHPTLDSGSRGLALGTAVACFGFGLYVVIRRMRRGPQP